MSPIGALSLGFCVVSSESQDVLTAAFELFKELLPPDAFYGRGANGPVCILTDDAEHEVKSLAAAWPSSKHLLCTWHLLNAVWRFLYNAKNKVQKQDRPILLRLFRRVVYAENDKDYETGD